MSAAHTNDPPKSNNIDASPIDRSLETNNDEAREASRPSSSSSTTETAKLPEDEQSLKKTWLTLLPTEQVIEILLKLDEALPQDAGVRQSVWPQDLKAAVFHAAVTKIVESSASTTTAINANANGNAKAGEKESEVKDPPVVQSAATPTTTNQSTQSRTTVTSTSATSSILRRPPPTSTTSYQAAAIASASATSSHSSPGSFYMYPFANGSIAYTHPANHQPYHFGSYSSVRPPLQSTSSAGAGASSSTNSPVLPPPPVSLSLSTPPPASGGPIMTNDDDLPSYEEMLVQALTVHNDPAGTAPKQLFQWMAATYPLQANFRPSASQALQKAFKRGRFEKNSEGRYRLNPRWEGGNTSRRTTRRPQSYSKSVLNPSPSSHPPRNSTHLVPQHYAWTQHQWTQHQWQQQGEVGKSQSPVPIPAAASRPTPSKLETVTEAGETEDHKSCMEAAYSILQALNITIPATGAEKTNTVATEKDDSVPPVTSTGQTGGGQPAMTVDEASPPPVTGAQTQQQSRSALRGTLALLAAQLAEIADGVADESAPANGAYALATGSGAGWI